MTALGGNLLTSLSIALGYPLTVVYYVILLLLILGELLGEIIYLIIIFPEYNNSTGYLEVLGCQFLDRFY